MQFEWDERKNRSNLLKHGISFEEALEIFDHPIISLPDTRIDYGEQRYLSIGLIRDVVIAAVVHTDRSGVTRIISARVGNRRERRLYNDHFR